MTRVKYGTNVTIIREEVSHLRNLLLVSIYKPDASVKEGNRIPIGAGHRDSARGITAINSVGLLPKTMKTSGSSRHNAEDHGTVSVEGYGVGPIFECPEKETVNTNVTLLEIPKESTESG